VRFPLISLSIMRHYKLWHRVFQKAITRIFPKLLLQYSGWRWIWHRIIIVGYPHVRRYVVANGTIKNEYYGNSFAGLIKSWSYSIEIRLLKPGGWYGFELHFWIILRQCIKVFHMLMVKKITSQYNISDWVFRTEAYHASCEVRNAFLCKVTLV
jgi:hypothetical protein